MPETDGKNKVTTTTCPHRGQHWKGIAMQVLGTIGSGEEMKGTMQDGFIVIVGKIPAVPMDCS
eukprot:1789177-Amphidinium_carterae.1